ncbi:MAG: 50S ribosomal protein L30 [Spirochaetia bacterium]|nr:MAG: 50S ribosomal protein L30 [Spirochaetia bacterium]
MNQDNHSSSSIKITLTKSTIGNPKDQAQTAVALGLRKVGAVAVLPANASVRGMVFKIKHLVTVEEIA